MIWLFVALKRSTALAVDAPSRGAGHEAEPAARLT